MNKEELSALVAEILAGMGEPPQVKSGPYHPENPGPEPREEGGSAEDVSAIDLRKLYLTENPQNGGEYLKLKARTPARLGMGKAGPRYKTLTMLRFRADHAAAQDAVFSQVPDDFAGKHGLVPIQTMCKDKEEYLTRPDLGRGFDKKHQESSKNLSPIPPLCRSWWAMACPRRPLWQMPWIAWLPSRMASKVRASIWVSPSLSAIAGWVRAMPSGM